MPDEVVRFPAQVPFDKWPKASRCYELMIAGDWFGLQNYFNDPANRQDITDSIGAVNWWRGQFQPDSYPTQIVGSGDQQEWLIPGQSPKDHQFLPGILYLWKADGGGNGSGSLMADVFMGGYAFTPAIDPNTDQPIIPSSVPKSAIIGINKGTAWPVPCTVNQQVGFINLGDAPSGGRVDIRIAGAPAPNIA